MASFTNAMDHLAGKTLESALNVGLKVDIQKSPTLKRGNILTDIQKSPTLKRENDLAETPKTPTLKRENDIAETPKTSTLKKENFLKTDQEDEKAVGQRIRKRDKFLRLLNKSSRIPTFYVEQPQQASSEMTTLPISSLDIEFPTANDEFVSGICEIQYDENLREKVKFALENWIGTW
jgi:hypothetical protein